MKNIVVAMVMLLVSTNALPQPVAIPEKGTVDIGLRWEDMVTDLIQGILDALTDLIVEAGFDPLEVDDFEGKLELLEGLADIDLVVRQLSVSGVGNIVISDIGFETGIDFTISLPQIRVTVGHIEANVNILGGAFVIDFQTSGSLTITNAGVSGSVDLSLVGGIGIDVTNLHIFVDDIHSDGTTTALGQDISNELNDFINITVPQLLRVYSDQIDELLDFIVTEIISLILG